MSPARCISCCWPGLPQLWRSGSWAALALALAWGLLANWLLAATLVWTEVVDPFVKQVGWAMLAASWLTGVVIGIRWFSKADSPGEEQKSTELLRRAQIEYLRGNWLIAEGQLNSILEGDSADVEALLLLVSLYRHTERKSKAGEHLRRLERLAAASRWQQEIEQEKQRLNEIDEPDVLAPEGGTNGPSEQPITQNAIDRNNNQHMQQPAAA